MITQCNSEFEILIKQLERLDEKSDCGKLLLCKTAARRSKQDDFRIRALLAALEVIKL